MGEEKELTIDMDYLQELLNYTSSSAVGKIMKRFEILGDNHKAIKLSTKELVYESFRELRDLIIAHNKGRNIKIFKFNKDHLTQEQK